MSGWDDLRGYWVPQITVRPISSALWEDPLDWVIVGGESGPRARPMDLAWARSLVVQCRAAGTACFVKQLGRRPVARRIQADDFHEAGHEGTDHVAIALRDSHGGDPEEWPSDLRVREFPEGAG